MRQKILCLILCIVFVGIFCANNADEAFAAQGDIYTQIDQYLASSVQKAHFPSMSVTIVDGDKTLLAKTYGDCADTDVPYLIGSASKSFTALCVMQLAEQGKLDLNEHLVSYLPDATDGDNITILQLLNHTSGLGEHQNAQNYKIVNKQGVHVYANVNYTLLGKVIEKVSGKSYADYLFENVLRPLDMSNTTADVNKANAEGLIQGYENWFGANVKTATKYSPSDRAWISASAGYIASSTADLGKYLQMYLNGGKGIVSAESIDKMFNTNVSVDANIPYKYGMGWTLIHEPLNQPVLRHGGWVETGMSAIYLLPQKNLGVAVTINTNDYFVGKDMMDRIDWSIALMLTGSQPNIIGDNEYALKHLVYDFIYLVIFAGSLLPLCLVKVYKRRLADRKLWLTITLLALLHIVLPILLLLAPQMFFATPLWVVKAFVPDLFTVLVVSACLLFAGGIAKTVLLILEKRK